jgi:hypothetical protein
MFEPVISHHFSKLGVALSKSFTRHVSGVISACNFSTYEIARHVSKINGKGFSTNERGLNYLLSNDNFQIDDNYWRMHINMIFALMSEQNLLQDGGKIYIQIDFTSSEDNFLILCASIIVNNRSIPIYFTMRNYPKKKDQYDHKKMESAFLNGLRHILSKKYQYVIVADRGFGNKRFIEACENCGFEYLIRITPNAKIKYFSNKGLMEEICQSNTEYVVQVVNWKKNLRVYRHSNEVGTWYLVSNINGLQHKESEDIYRNRFKIEKCFQDMKSSGFDMENSKIRKYSNYKRLLAMCMVAHALLVLLGNFIVNKAPYILKNSAEMAGVTLAYFQSEERHTTYFQKNK